MSLWYQVFRRWRPGGKETVIPEPYQGPQIGTRYLTAESSGFGGFEGVVGVYGLSLVRTPLLFAVKYMSDVYPMTPIHPYLAESIDCNP